MVVFMFQEQFASKVKDGTKPHTIRKKSKRVVRVGDVLSLRKWSGKPYRSKQVMLREAVCTKVVPLSIDRCGDIRVERDDGVLLMTRNNKDVLAKKDGFEDFDAMLDWFRETHGLPFEGVLIQWETRESK